jgi:hypothetical protein
MWNRTSLLLLIASAFIGMLWAAEDPFVGEWKLNAAKTTLRDEMKVASAGPNKYTFDFGGDMPETIVIDGTDQPGLAGTTLAVSALGPDSWKVVRKKDGNIIVTANWKLSADSNVLSDDFTFVPPNGSATNVKYEYKRTAGKGGFAGTWESTSAQIDSVFVLQVRPYEQDGLTFIDPQQTKNVKFDGLEHPNRPALSATSSVSSGRRVDGRTLEVTDKVNGKIVATRQIELSPDLKTLTMTVHPAGKDKPNILVFDRK